MAKIKFIGIIDSASGKVCQHSDTSFVHNRYTNTCHTMRVHKRDTPLEPSQKQIAVREAMKTRGKVVGYFIKQVAKNDPAIMKQLTDIRAAKQLNSITTVANLYYDKERELITFEGKQYAPGYMDSSEQGGFGS